MKFKVFTKIFELNPKEVEKFIIEYTKKKYHFDTKEEKEQWLENFRLEVKWYPDCNDFYVYTEPNIKRDNKNHWTFKGKEISLDEYLWYQGKHHHYNFYEIYGLMTGETEIWSFCDNCDNDILFLYSGVYRKEYIDIIKTRTNEWFIRDWEINGKEIDDETGEEYYNYKEIRKPIPADLLEYVISLNPEEVKLR